MCLPQGVAVDKVDDINVKFGVSTDLREPNSIYALNLAGGISHVYRYVSKKKIAGPKYFFVHAAQTLKLDPNSLSILKKNRLHGYSTKLLFQV